MKCGSCGFEASSGKFCQNCGAPLPVSEPEPVEAEPVVQDAQQVESASVVPPVYDHAPGQGNVDEAEPIYEAEPVYDAEPAAAPVTPGKSSEGILDMAWKDVSKDPSFKKRVALLGLVQCIPILNFAVTGYSLRWARRAAFRSGDQLPEKLFGDKAFETGFFVFVIMLVWGLVMGLACIIPLVGWIFALAIVPLALLASFFYSLTDELGSAFRIKDLVEAAKRNYGGLLVFTYIPGLVAGLIISVFSFILAAAIGVNVLAVVVSEPMTDAAILSAILASGFLWTLLILLFVYLSSVVGVIANLVSCRAFGYWIGRMAPEWVQESISKGTGV